MKTTLFSLAAMTFLGVPAASGAVTQVFTFNGVNMVVPDGNPAGAANQQTISSTIATIDSVTVSLIVNGTFNGDLYAYVAHDNSIAVLVNRPGSTTVMMFGYADSGMDVTFDDAQPVSRDIHIYQSVVVPPPSTPLTGAWQPDGRNVDPNVVTDASPRTAMLSVFNTQAASGDWTLFVADMAGGNEQVVEGWTLTITGEPIPEPSSMTLAAMAAFVLVRRRRAPRRAA